MEPTITEGTKGEMSLEVIDETISEESGLLATRFLGVAIKEEVVDEGYVPYKSRKMTKALTGKLIQTKKTIHKKAEIEAKVVELCSSDEEMKDVSRVMTTAVKQEEEEGNDDDEGDSDDDAEYTGESSEDSSDDEFGVSGLKQIYEQHFGGDEEQQMDITEETKGAEVLEQTSKVESTSKATIKVKKSEKPRVATEILPHEPPMMRCRTSITLEKTLGEHLLEQFEKLEAERVARSKGDS